MTESKMRWPNQRWDDWIKDEWWLNQRCDEQIKDEMI